MIKKRILIVSSLVAIFGLTAPLLDAERLAVHTYTVADGLAGDQVSVIAQDGRGFLWIGTRTGLSRFDGVSFRSFDRRDGLPHAGVFDILEDSDGSLWFGTGAGVVRMRTERDGEGSVFELAAGITEGVVSLVEDNAGVLWASAAGVLYRRDALGDRGFVAVETAIPWLPNEARAIASMVAADGGGLWLGTNIGLFLLQPDGTIERLSGEETRQSSRIATLFRDGEGRVWTGGRTVTVFKPDPHRRAQAPVVDLTDQNMKTDGRFVLPERPGDVLQLDPHHGSDTGVIFDIDEGPDGRVWMAGHQGLYVVNGGEIASFGRRNGLLSNHLGPILVDDAGNAWIGTQSHGLMRVNSTGFTSFTEDDGLLDRQTTSVTSGPSGEMVVIGFPPEEALYVHQGETFLPVKIPLPSDVRPFGWGLNQVTFFDHNGQLWVPTPKGLFRFPVLADISDLPTVRFQRRYLEDDTIYRLFEDSRGDLWLGVFGDSRLIRWQRSTDTLHRYDADDGIPYQAGTAFTEDRSGAVWIGFYQGGLARWRGGSFEFFDREDGVPSGLVNCLMVDHLGRLWVGAHGDGLAMTEDPTVDRPQWTILKNAEGGFLTEGIFSLAEDRFGRIYAGSLKGVDRLNPATGRMDHFDTATGLVNNLVLSALAGPNGDIWFATDGGVSRYRPEVDVDREAPQVLVDRVTVDGVDLTVPLRGVSTVARIPLSSSADVVDIGFAAVDLTPGSRLEFDVAIGPDAESWSAVRGQRFVRLAGLAPGDHQILIRARLPDGSVGQPATVDLHIAIPLWRRWWFLVAVAIGLAAAAWLVQRWRMQRLVELHRVRSRIASDLHDEMGLSLVRVAILADMAGQGGPDPSTSETLIEIGNTARDLVDATSDMAWALDPRHDTLAALIARFRRVAGDVVEGTGARFTFVGDPLEGVALGSEARRHLLLILKEAMRNACRHGKPDNVAMTVKRRQSRIVITLEDDGIGFDTSLAADGQGLLSMERRARALGATFEIKSSTADGTKISLNVPLTRDA